MNNSKWNVPKTDPVIPAALQGAGYSPLLAAILHVRGLSTPELARNFLENTPDLLGDPLLLIDMPQAVMRLTRAIAAGEKVAVYGDYDVDGITSSCMLTDYLRSKGLECTLYIPDRLEEGYGVNNAAIEKLHSEGVTLIITVDCGVTTVEEAAFASSIGVDMIITDHHECREVLPEAIAVVDPKRPDCSYPTHDLAGIGVAFKLLCALEGSAENIINRYADLVAVGTIADVMPLTGENRYIVKKGLDKLANAPRPGLRALIEEAGLGEKKISATNVGFTLAPRLNASGRLGHVDLATSLLLADSQQTAAGLAADLCQLNRDRQALETDIWQQALEMIGDEKPDVPIVLASENWHQGIIGIAASRLTEAFNVPAIMICLDGEKGKGSCRSCGSFNLFEALSECSEHLEDFGGHALAAGLTVRRENIDSFRAALADYYRSHPSEGVATLDFDLCINSPDLLAMDCVEDLERIEPCGSGNPRPLMCLPGAVLTDITPIGSGKHLRLRLEKFGQTYEAVFFSHTAEELGLRCGDCVDAAFFPQINEFRARRSVQFLIRELRRHETEACAAILRGDISDDDAPFCPDRAAFTALWLALRNRGGSLSAPLDRFFLGLCPTVRDEKLCLCLKVFEEFGLVSVQLEGDMLTVSCIPRREKVNLDLSELLQRLRRLNAGAQG
ncbi:MAG: single-stranded-DNA-specific exonuclease RecJ [Ruminococcaceae bacterium]|nr:single-stranded-DNA-specific exonuclease RecJ [Oscillospiraceae bacterium]